MPELPARPLKYMSYFHLETLQKSFHPAIDAV